MNRRILALDGLLYNAKVLFDDVFGAPDPVAVSDGVGLGTTNDFAVGKIIVVDDSNLIVETITDSAAIGHIKLTIRRVRAERQSARPE